MHPPASSWFFKCHQMNFLTICVLDCISRALGCRGGRIARFTCKFNEDLSTAADSRETHRLDELLLPF